MTRQEAIQLITGSGGLIVGGSKYGRLTVIRQVESRNKRRVYLCRCRCGSRLHVIGKNLRNGNTRSCGCLRKDRTRETHTKHGMRNSPEYDAWRAMKSRCYKKHGQDYRHYGGRGIRVDGRWLGPSGFKRFFRDMGPRPSSRHTLERINNDGDYGPGNCCWATRKEQANNRRRHRRNRWISHNGEKKIITEWARQAGISAALLGYRLAKGIPFAEALKPPHLGYSHTRRKL